MYEAEGLEWSYVAWVDNQPCLDLIDRKDAMGILPLLDEECAIASGTDGTFVRKVWHYSYQ